MTRLPLLTNSAAKTFRRCPREYKFSYQDGYRSRHVASELQFGSLFHAALESWWRAPINKRLDCALEDLVHKSDAFDNAKASALLIGYDARWGGEPLETVAVEREFRIPLVNPDTGAASKTWELGGKIDAIARNTETGELWVIEHKTASASIDLEDGSLYWERLKLDSQIGLYIDAARSIGFAVAGCIYDVIIKPGFQPREATPLASRRYRKKDGALDKRQRETGETPHEFYDRLVADIAERPDSYFRRSTPQVRLESDVEDGAHDRWQVGRLIREAQLAGRWPRNVDACERYRRPCSYWDVCTHTTSLDNPTRFRRIDPENPHEELNAQPGT